MESMSVSPNTLAALSPHKIKAAMSYLALYPTLTVFGV